MGRQSAESVQGSGRREGVRGRGGEGVNGRMGEGEKG